MSVPTQGPAYPMGAPAQQPVGKVKKPIWKRWWFWVLAVIVVIVIASPKGGGDTTAAPQPAESQTQAAQEAPAEETAPEAPAEEAGLPGLGTPVAAGDLEITVNNVSTTDELESPLGNKSGHWVVVDVTIKNNGQKQVTVNSSDFTLIESDGTEYSTDSDNLMYLDSEKNLFLQQINPKLSAEGQVLFATPEAAKDFTLKVRGGFLGPEAEIDLKS